MFDHVTIGTADRDASERFYRTVLGALDHAPSAESDDFVEWNDFSIAQADGRRPVTTRLHVAFVAASRERMEAFWRAGVEAGYRDDGPPGPRPQYAPDYEGAFLLDPDGNSVEATFRGDMRTEGRIDHLWFRVGDRDASRRFYGAIAEAAGFREDDHLPDRTRYTGGPASGSFSIVDGPATSPFHVAFAVAGRAAVERFHRTAIAAGARDNGAPGERPEYHPGYFAAFVVDPDGHNVEVVDHGR